MKKIILIVVLLLVAVVACLWWINKKDKNEQAEDKFVKVVDGHFQRNGKPYYYVGTMGLYSDQRVGEETEKGSARNSMT